MRKLDFGSLITVLVAAVINRSVLLMMNPLGIAYFASAYITASGRGFLFIASLVGMATVMPIKILLKYAGVMTGMVVIEKILRKSFNKAAVWQMALSSAALIWAAGVAYTLGLGSYEGEALGRIVAANFLEAVSTFCLVFIFSKALNVICTKDGKRPLSNEEQLCTGILIAASLYAVSGPVSEKYSILQAVAFFLLFYFGYKYGCGASSVIGACIGTVMALNTADMAMLGYMCLAGIVTGAFREKGKVMSICISMLAMGFMGWAGASYMIEMTTVRGIISGALIFLFLPVTKAETQKLLQDNRNALLDMPAEVTKMKLKDFANAFKKLSETFQLTVLPRLDLSKTEVENAFDEVTQNVCATCSHCELCWEREYGDTYQAANNILEFCSKNGSIAKSQVPISFRHRCINIDSFINETGRAIELEKLNLAWENRFMESRLAVAGQFMEVADIINDFSDSLDEAPKSQISAAGEIKKRLTNKKMKVRDVSVIEKSGHGMRVYISAKMRRGRYVTAREICKVLKDVLRKAFVLGKGCRMVVSKEYMTYEFVEDTCYRVIEGSAMCCADQKQISGDTYTTMRLDNGQVIMSLSDGMGTGKNASEESEYIIKLMEQMMDTGFGKRAAVRLMNSLLFLKSDGKTFSTVDMGLIDLYTGQCEFVKMGAAASAIIHGQTGEIEIIESCALPAGAFTEVNYDEVSRQLRDGDMIVMVSDGVIQGLEQNEIQRRDNDPVCEDKKIILENNENLTGSECLKKCLESMEEDNPQGIADRVLWRARSRSAAQKDDMTVLVCGIYRNV